MVIITESKLRNSFVNMFVSICDVGDLNHLIYDTIISNDACRVDLAADDLNEGPLWRDARDFARVSP